MDLKQLQKDFNFFETPTHHALNIYNEFNPKETMNVIDICCGLGSLIEPWYHNGHNVTLIEL